MRTMKLLGFFFVCICFVLAGGCNAQLRDLQIQNQRQGKLIEDLDSQLRTAKMERDQLDLQLKEAQKRGGIDEESLRERVKALEEDLKKKNQLIATMQEQLLHGVAPLPVELSTMLEDFAKQYGNMVTYDASRGIVKFKSDLLFEMGSDQVAASAVQTIRSLCDILNSNEAKKFDVMIVGHTDDIPIERPATRAKHPTNWHLSVHRGISVLELMTGSKINPERLSVRGFGEYRPLEPNLAGKKGNPQNRRVEIYIVPTGA